ncbi:MAG: TonB-dependent receptor [Bacteroidales bacterium]|nr:TonB-dependent receptor [Bacteroidales bacterium]
MKKLLIFIFCLSVSACVLGQKSHTDANIVGHVTCCGEHIPFASVSVVGTTIGTTTDETGHYRMINLPEGDLAIRVQSLGYKPKELKVHTSLNQTITLKFELEKDALGIEEVVITGDRNEKNRAESSTVVNTITGKIFNVVEAVTLSEGLNFCPGLRMENDCQNCGFTQVRMNGMDGPYSQILINSRPIFSGLAGVYGLELIPTNMIERVEVIRGGGSALYGSNAIAGTINLILKDPITNTYEFGFNSASIGIGMPDAGSPAPDFSTNVNTSLVSSDNRTGMAVYGFYRSRKPFDANDDDFSEVASLNNTTLGSRLFHRFSSRNKLSLDFFHIHEKRRGGDRFDYPLHEANIAEAVEHNLTTAALTFDQFVRSKDLLSAFVAVQYIDRDSYYGANQSLSDYGNTTDLTYNLGVQYNAHFSDTKLVVGIETQGERLVDTKLGYPDFDHAVIENDSILFVPHTENVMVADQESRTSSIFAQYEFNLYGLKTTLGGRFDRYSIQDYQIEGSEKSGNVLSPRLSFLYDIKRNLQARVSYGQGYRAPQIFDEDLHIETSGSRQVIHRNAPDLKQETSSSFMASLDGNKQWQSVSVGLLIEGFYTQLKNPFTNTYSEPDAQGVVVYTRENAAKGAAVSGVNTELNVVTTFDISLTAGFTFQRSEYEEAQEFDEKKFLRTPDQYGYLTADYKLNKHWAASASFNYTGSMLVPYFGEKALDPDLGELIKTGSFFDLGLKLQYTIKINGASMQVYGGVKNLFNSYQNDFDEGIDRDPGYIYGPILPRTVYAGLKIGNMLGQL